MTATPNFLSGAKLAVRLGVTEHVVRKAVRTGVLSPDQVGRAWAFPAGDLPAIRAKLFAAGLMPAPSGLPVTPIGPVA